MQYSKFDALCIYKECEREANQQEKTVKKYEKLTENGYSGSLLDREKFHREKIKLQLCRKFAQEAFDYWYSIEE